MKDTTKHYKEQKFIIEWLQTVTIKVHLEGHEYAILAAYSPPKHNIKKDEYTMFLKSLSNYFIIGGDFNAKHRFFGSRLITTKGRELFKGGTDLKWSYMSGGGCTYWPIDPNKLPDLIDFFILKGISANYCHVEDYFDLTSDHSAVIMLSKLPVKKSAQITLENRFTKWAKVKTELEETFNLKVPFKRENTCYM